MQKVECQSTLIPAGSVDLAADIAIPYTPSGLVLFAHGSGSSRHSPRNRWVAGVLNRASMGTILIDLLAEPEEIADRETAEYRFDIGLLTARLTSVTDWIGTHARLRSLELGYFGASTGAAAALAAAAERPDVIRAIVSRGGRPDLAGASLHRVHAASLFIVGGADPVVLRLNQEAAAQMPHDTEKRIEVVPGATHLFEEPGTLERVSELAAEWFRKHFASHAR
ncbi:MAG: hypothetical protein KGN84_00485 [Acidobacteriota bacterium]|nr:hypothetical protein [Acidobacteriota bacterium]